MPIDLTKITSDRAWELLAADATWATTLGANNRIVLFREGVPRHPKQGLANRAPADFPELMIRPTGGVGGGFPPVPQGGDRMGGPNTLGARDPGASGLACPFVYTRQMDWEMLFAFDAEDRYAASQLYDRTEYVLMRAGPRWNTNAPTGGTQYDLTGLHSWGPMRWKCITGTGMGGLIAPEMSDVYRMVLQVTFPAFYAVLSTTYLA